MNSTTTQVYSIIAIAARAAYAELTTDDAIAIYKAKAEQDIYTTYQAMLWATNMAYMMGVIARGWVDQFVDDSTAKPLALPPVKPLALPASVETVEAEIVEDEAPKLLKPAFIEVVEQVTRQREAFKQYVLSVMLKNAHRATARELKRMLGIPSSSRMKKRQVLALLPGGHNV